MQGHLAVVWLAHRLELLILSREREFIMYYSSFVLSFSFYVMRESSSHGIAPHKRLFEI